MPNEVWDIEDAGYDPDAHAILLHRDRAVHYADTYGIYAVPCRHGKAVYWRPRKPSGHDPDIGWLIKNEPTFSGWPSWADAVVALGEHMDMENDS